VRYVLDASVAVAALRSNEPFHADALRRCMPLFGGRDEIVVPALFDIEVVAALVRRGVAPGSVERFFKRHFATRTLVTLGPRTARAVCRVVGLTRLRAADALYVWLAAREGLPLVTADREVLNRAPLAGVTAVVP
jgi:predicted nucleic acid-binding protein